MLQWSMTDVLSCWKGLGHCGCKRSLGEGGKRIQEAALADQGVEVSYKLFKNSLQMYVGGKGQEAWTELLVNSTTKH